MLNQIVYVCQYEKDGGKTSFRALQGDRLTTKQAAEHVPIPAAWPAACVASCSGRECDKL